MTMTGFRVVCCISLMLLLNLSSVSRVIGVILSASEPSQIHEDENVDKLVKTVVRNTY